MDSMETATATGGSSSKLILSIIAIVVVIGIGYAVMRNDDGASGDDVATTTDETAFSGDIFSLVSRGGDWKCTWEAAQDGFEVTGTVFVSRGKFKSSSEMEGQGMTVTAHAIGDGDYVYSWTSLMPTGIKFPVEKGAEGVAVSGTNAQAQQFGGSYDYDCEPWRADSGTFALPTGVTFSDFAVPQQ